MKLCTLVSVLRVGVAVHSAHVFFFSDIKRGQKKKKKVVCLKHVYVTGSICSRIAELQEDERERERAKKNPMAAVVR